MPREREERSLLPSPAQTPPWGSRLLSFTHYVLTYPPPTVPVSIGSAKERKVEERESEEKFGGSTFPEEENTDETSRTNQKHPDPLP